MILRKVILKELDCISGSQTFHVVDKFYYFWILNKEKSYKILNVYEMKKYGLLNLI